MRFLEDLTAGERFECGHFTLSRAEIIRFAQRFDPQPFHTDDEAARQSLFGRLTASSLHAASVSRKLVMQVVLRDLSFVGSPGARRVHMHRPVYPDATVRVSHAIERIEWLQAWPGVGQVESVTQGMDADGNLLVTIESQDWIHARAGQNDFAASAHRRMHGAPPEVRGPGPFGQTSPSATHPQRPARLFLEDCTTDAVFTSDEHEVGAHEIADFQREFDPFPAAQGRPPMVNEWLGTCLGTRLNVDAFWSRSALAGGTGMKLVRWPAHVVAGDRLRGEVRITGARSSQSRPKVGLIEAVATCTNQRSEVVSQYATTAFIWKRPW